MTEQYKTVYEGGEGEIVEKKSRFIATVRPVETEEEALAFIEEMKKKYWDARHNCSAYVLGERQELMRCSDDGEPSQTAGKPMMDVLTGAGLTNVAVVVTRYFGGIKLGTGGLVRAYTKGAKIALEAAGLITKVLYQVIVVSVDYTMLGALQNQLRLKQYDTKDIVYDEMVHLHVWVAEDDVAGFKAQIIEWTNGRAVIEDGEVSYRIME